MKTIIPRARLGRLPTIGNIAPTLVFVSFTKKNAAKKNGVLFLMPLESRAWFFSLVNRSLEKVFGDRGKGGRGTFTKVPFPP